MAWWLSAGRKTNRAGKHLKSVTANHQQRRASRPGWLVWSVSIGEALLLLIVAFALSRYWLMLPVWMRRTAVMTFFLVLRSIMFILFSCFCLTLPLLNAA